MATRTLERLVTRASEAALRRAKRLGYQVYFINNCTEIGVEVWALRNQFSRGIGMLGPELDIERCDFYIPRQYNDQGMLTFPALSVSHINDIAVGSRIYDPTDNKLYEVDMVYGDAEGFTNTAVYQLNCSYRHYNPFVGDWTPGSDNIIAGLPPINWNTINYSTSILLFNGYFVDASANAVDLLMPTSPYKGYTVVLRVIDCTFPITINGNGYLIEGQDSLVITEPAHNAAMWLVYSSPSFGGWRVTTSIN